MTADPISAAAAGLCDTLTAMVDPSLNGGRGHWFEFKIAPNYFKLLLHEGPSGERSADPATFCFVVRSDAPFGWANYRAGDVLPPMTARKPWKMDTGAVASVLAPDGGLSYWVHRYEAELSLWRML